MVVNVKNDHGWLIYGDNYLIIYYIYIERERVQGDQFLFIRSMGLAKWDISFVNGDFTGEIDQQ